MAPYVEFFCQAGYVAGFEVSYKVGKEKKTVKKSLSVGNVARYAFPAEAQSINVKGRTKGLLPKAIFDLDYETPPNKRIKVYGTIFKPNYTVE